MRDREIAYWEQVSDRALKDNIHKRQAVVKRLLGEDLIGKDILEIGCGAGTAFGAINVVLLSHFRYLGTDLSPTWVDGMKTHWNLPAVQADILSIPTKDNQFDVVVALDSLEHVRPEDRVDGYKELLRVMKPGAKLLINMPLEETLHNPEFDHEFNLEDISTIARTFTGKVLTSTPYTVNCAGGPRSYRWVVIENRKGAIDEGLSIEADIAAPLLDGHRWLEGSPPAEPVLRTSGLAQQEEKPESLSTTKQIFEIRTPWDNAWIPLYKNVIEEVGHTFQLNQGKGIMHRPDVVFHMWADNVQILDGAVNFVFMRRYELYSTNWLEYDWSKIDKFVFCNQWIMERAQEMAQEAGVKLPVCGLVHNAVDLDAWTYKERHDGKNVGMACYVNQKKNLPLAAQIMLELPPDYTLHIAGGVQDAFTADYMHNLLGDRVKIYGHVPHGKLDEWWEGMNYCLSTSISEGNPNNVIEAMAKGIKPIVHNWPGADGQFMTFKTVYEAAKGILPHGIYDSKEYRGHVHARHTMHNYSRIVEDALTRTKRKG